MKPARSNPGTIASAHHRPQRWLRVGGIEDRGWELALPQDAGIRKSRGFQSFCAGAVSAGYHVPVGVKPSTLKKRDHARDIRNKP